MIYPALLTFVLLLLGSAYLYMRSQQEARQRSDLLYGELIPCLEGATVRKSRHGVFPLLEGYFQKYRIKIVPVIDTLTLRALPRLYFRVSVYADNSIFCRILPTPQRSYLCTPASGAGVSITPDPNRPEIKMFMMREPENKEFSRIVDIITQLDTCTEVLITKNFLMATFLAAKAEKSYYRVLRAAIFPAIVIEQQKFLKNLRLLMELREEVARLAPGQEQMA